MGSRGPIKKNLQLVGGSLPNDIPQPKPAMPKMPPKLSAEAKKEWRRVARPLHNLGLFTELDRQTLTMYCEAVARYERAQAYLLENGDTFTKENGEPKQRPEYYIMADSLKELRQFISLFGLSPSARLRLELPEAKTDQDELAQMLD